MAVISLVDRQPQKFSEIVDLLRKLLERAESGELEGVAAVVVSKDNAMPEVDYWFSHWATAIGAVEVLAETVRSEVLEG